MNDLIDLFKPVLKQCKEHISTSKLHMTSEEKAGSDLVTNLDFEIEEKLIHHIKSLFPEDLIIAEETSVEALTDAPTWVIDPIDGTVNFYYGSKIYGIQFCRMICKEAVFTILYLPELDDLFYAVKDHGAYRNGVRLQGHPNMPIKDSLVSFGDFSKSSMASRPYQMKLMDALKEEVLKVRIFGSSCMDFSALASGQTHAHIMFSKRIWEFASGLLLLSETGVFTERISIEGTDITAICGAHNPSLLQRIRNILCE